MISITSAALALAYRRTEPYFPRTEGVSAAAPLRFRSAVSMRDKFFPEQTPPPTGRADSFDGRRSTPRGIVRARSTSSGKDAQGNHVAARATPSVLIVEADPDQQWRLARDLTAVGVRVVGTSSGEGALALLAEWRVDLVLVADELPGIDGMEVCRRVLKQQVDMRVLMVADDTEHVCARAKRAGAQGCLKRPVDMRCVSRHLAQARAD